MEIKNFEEIIKKHHGSSSGFSRHYLTLYSIVLGLETKNAFEFGSGFSSKVILEALKETGGKLTTNDARSIKETGNDPRDLEENKDRWTYLQSSSKEALEKMKSEVFDFVLHDGSHEWKVVKKDLQTIIPRMKKDGIILVHDTAHTNFKLNMAVKMALFWYKHEKVTLPYGYGLTIIRIKKNFGNGSVITSWKKNK